MKKLLENQNVKIDNHQPGAEVKNLDGLHIHKRMNGNDKWLGNADISIPLDGKANIRATGQNKDRLVNEIRQIFEDQEKVIKFINDIDIELTKIKPDLTAEELEQIANHILDAFNVRGNKFRTMDYRDQNGKLITFEATFKEEKDRYFVRIKNEYIYIEGNVKEKRN